MIVPFVYNLYNLSPQCDFLWIFYKFADFCIKNNMPIIAQEEHFIDPKIYKEQGNHAISSSKYYNYKIYTKEQLNNIINYKINSDFSDKIKNSKTFEKDWISLLSKKNISFKKEIEIAINSIEKQTKKKIKTIICWLSFPSLVQVCKEKNINLINFEMSSIRKNNFNYNLGYFSKNTKYNSKEFEQNYKKFDSDKILTRKEILTLFSQTENLNFINQLNEEPTYEFGIVSGMENDVYELANEYTPYDEIAKKLKEITDDKNVLIRTHPAKPLNVKNYNYEIDQSKTIHEFILKCKRLVCNLSNVTYEVMLYGKTLYVMSERNTFYGDNINKLNIIEEKVIDLKYLNYATFGYFTPLDLMYDIDYINWRIKATPKEIYEYNLKHIFKDKKIDYDKFFKLKNKERLPYIINKCHQIKEFKVKTLKDKVSKEEIYLNQISEINQEKEMLLKNLENNQINLNQKNNELKISNNQIEELNNTIKDLKDSTGYLKKEIQDILNSKSWKITKPIRKISGLLKK